MPRLLLVLCLLVSGCASAPDDAANIATYSIIAADTDTGEIGVAVQSRFLAVGAVVPWAKAGVGAVATQAWADPSFGPRGLNLLDQGVPPEEAIDRMLANDGDAARRQVAIIDAQGRAAAFTGEQCFAWAGHRVGVGYSVQGNILASEQVLTDMAAAFENTHGELAERLLAALDAAQAAGGDKRGKQSAALLVVREGWGFGGHNDRYIDLRVDDDPQPLKKLREIYDKHRRLLPGAGVRRQEAGVR